MQKRSAHLLNAKDKVGHVDQLLQRAEAVAVARARACLEAAAHDAAADVDVRRRSVLIREPQRVLEHPDLVGLVAPAQLNRCMRSQARWPHGALNLRQLLAGFSYMSSTWSPRETRALMLMGHAECIFRLHACGARAEVCRAHLRGVLPGGTTLSK